MTYAATISDFRDFRRSLACHSSAVNYPIPIIFANLVDSGRFYNVAKLQTCRLESDVVSNGQTFGKIKTALSRRAAMFGQPYLGTQHTYSCRVPRIHRRHGSLLRGQNSRVYEGNALATNGQTCSIVRYRAVSGLARNRLSPSILVFRRNMFFTRFRPFLHVWA